MPAIRVDDVNIDIIKKCRSQAGLSLLEAGKKVHHIAEIEAGTYRPTFVQLDKLARMYKVPRWVFISEELPEQYDFTRSVPAFRQFSEKNPMLFSDPKVRSITAKINNLRVLLLDLLEDLEQGIAPFSPPPIDLSAGPFETARTIREWLGVGNDSYSFKEWKEILENRGVFIFVTSKYVGWSHIEREKLRGFSVFHETLPIIVINNTDWKSAQSFSLFHELGHLLRKENSIDDWTAITQREEKWCDDFAGCFLIPKSALDEIRSRDINLDAIKRISRTLKISSYAVIVHLRRFNIIEQADYESFEEVLVEEHRLILERQKENNININRDRASEVLQQYGHLFSRTVITAYNNNEIGLYKLAKLLDIKNISTLTDIEARL